MSAAPHSSYEDTPAWNWAVASVTIIGFMMFLGTAIFATGDATGISFVLYVLAACLIIAGTSMRALNRSGYYGLLYVHEAVAVLIALSGLVIAVIRTYQLLS